MKITRFEGEEVPPEDIVQTIRDRIDHKPLTHLGPYLFEIDDAQHKPIPAGILALNPTYTIPAAEQAIREYGIPIQSIALYTQMIPEFFKEGTVQARIQEEKEEFTGRKLKGFSVAEPFIRTHGPLQEVFSEDYLTDIVRAHVKNMNKQIHQIEELFPGFKLEKKGTLYLQEKKSLLEQGREKGKTYGALDPVSITNETFITGLLQELKSRYKP